MSRREAFAKLLKRTDSADLKQFVNALTQAERLGMPLADVLRVQAPHLASVPPFVFDTGHGKLSTHLDLREAGAVAELLALVRTGDVFSEGYRAGSLARRGFGAEELAAIRPGIVEDQFFAGQVASGGLDWADRIG